MDTSTKRDLVHSAYNERHQECEAAARYFNVPSLRDVSLGDLEAARGHLAEQLHKRARHVITENMRTLQAAQAMREGNTTLLGGLINESHGSLRDDFEVSSDELDLMVELARSQRGCMGARLTGAGFGGRAIALVWTQELESFLARIQTLYEGSTDLTMQGYVCKASDGVRIDKS